MHNFLRGDRAARLAHAAHADLKRRRRRAAAVLRLAAMRLAAERRERIRDAAPALLAACRAALPFVGMATLLPTVDAADDAAERALAELEAAVRAAAGLPTDAEIDDMAALFAPELGGSD